MFSGAVKLANLDADYIAPSQACIKSLPETSSSTAEVAKLDIAFDGSFGHFNQIREKENKAKITLNDCLACSGCVTSAETVLMEAQSLDSLIQVLESKDESSVICSISPQSRVTLADSFGFSNSIRFFQVFSQFLKTQRIESIFDTTFALDIAIQESCQEFLSRFESQENLPVLSGECPGFVCYAEKTQHQLLPLISQVKSPQQILAAIIRNKFKDRASLFHFAIMPCYDKKLEATRDDLVDLVLTTKEAFEFLSKRGFTEFIASIREEEFLEEPSLHNFDFVSQRALAPAKFNAQSGGYLEAVFRHAARKLFSVDLNPLKPLEYKVNKRNPDFQEVCLEIDGEVKLRFAIAYGFRNVQNLVRKLKTCKVSYHYVEVMACPSGCFNGGGQILALEEQFFGEKKPISALNAHKDQVKKWQEIYHSELEYRDYQDNKVATELVTCQALELKTCFKAVEFTPTEMMLGSKW